MVVHPGEEDLKKLDSEATLPSARTAARTVDVVSQDFDVLVSRCNALVSPWLAEPAIAAVLDGPGPVVVLADGLLSLLPLEGAGVDIVHAWEIVSIDRYEII